VNALKSYRFQCFLRAALIAALLILLLLVFGGIVHTEETRQAPGSRYLILSDVTDDREVSRMLEQCKKAGPVHLVIGRLGVRGNLYEHTAFLFVRDAGFQYRIVYYKTVSGIPIILVMLPGGLVDVKAAELFSEIKPKKGVKK